MIVDYRLDVKDYSDVLNQLNENFKVYHRTKSDFKEGGNLCKFLQEGNVLIIDHDVSLGFEWTTVIVIENDGGRITYHDCNFMLRCTTNLIVVKEEHGDYSDGNSD